MDWFIDAGLLAAFVLWILAEVQLHLVRASVVETVDLWRSELRWTERYARIKALIDMAENLDSLIGICEPAESQGLKLASQVCRNWARARDDDAPVVNETNAP